MTLLQPRLTPRQMRKARREHAGLRAEWAKAPWWHIASGYYTITCSCGWTDPKPIPTYPTAETGPFLNDLAINLAMNRHLETVYGVRG